MTVQKETLRQILKFKSEPKIDIKGYWARSFAYISKNAPHHWNIPGDGEHYSFYILIFPDRVPSEFLDFIVYEILNFSSLALNKSAGPIHFLSLARSELIEKIYSE